MTHLTTSHDVDAEREAAISWLHIKLIEGTAGLDPYDSATVIVEVTHIDRAWRIDLIGQQLIHHPHTRRDLSTCIQVRCLIEADVRMRLGLDEIGAPFLRDTPLASRSALSEAALREARADILEFDRSRRAGRGYR